MRELRFRTLRRRTGILCGVGVLLAHLGIGFAGGAPLEVLEPVEGTGGLTMRPGAHAALVDRVAETAEEIRRRLVEAPACWMYFRELGVDLEDWLSPGGPPYVVPRPLGRFSGRHRERTCGGAQSREPFEALFVDWRCFRGPRLCELASLLLHELGHLARRDTTDREPREFFAACRLDPCIDPARYE